jgi:glycosyltransferase involved in cell wall biosynthesis
VAPDDRLRSTDHSVAVIDRLATSDQRIRSIKLASNQGAIAAINIGIGEARGQYLAMVAADDFVEANLIEILHAALLAAPGAAFASGEVKVVDLARGIHLGYRPPARPSFVERYFSSNQTASLLKRIDNFKLTGAALFDRHMLVESGGLRPELGALADGYIARKLALRYGFVFVPKVLAQWRISAAGLSRGTATRLDRADALTRAATAAFADDPIFPASYAKKFAARWHFAVLRLALDNPGQGVDVISHFSPGPRVLRKHFKSVAMAGYPGRFAALAWATLWYRPTSLSAVILTYLARLREN